MALYMGTTKIATDATVAEIQRVLGKYGAAAIMTEYDKGEVVGVAFKIRVNEKDVPFRLPCRWGAVYVLLTKRWEKIPADAWATSAKQHAKRVAWRQILRWVEAQMALVETGMVKVEEVFMPYVQVSITGQTLYEKLETSGFLLKDMR